MSDLDLTERARELVTRAESLARGIQEIATEAGRQAISAYQRERSAIYLDLRVPANLTHGHFDMTVRDADGAVQLTRSFPTAADCMYWIAQYCHNRGDRQIDLRVRTEAPS